MEQGYLWHSSLAIFLRTHINYIVTESPELTTNLHLVSVHHGILFDDPENVDARPVSE